MFRRGAPHDSVVRPIRELPRFRFRESPGVEGTSRSFARAGRGTLDPGSVIDRTFTPSDR